MAQAPRDENRIATLLGTSNADGTTPITVYADPITHRLLVDASGAGSTVTMEVPSGTVDASNNVFTVTNTPIFVVVDNKILPLVSDINDINGNGFTYSAGTLTVNSLVPPVSFIRSFYNA